jgi:hypothetical protein
MAAFHEPDLETAQPHREEFRALASVRKSPRNEPAVRLSGLWGFDDFGLVYVSRADSRLAHIAPKPLDFQPFAGCIALLIGADAAAFCLVGRMGTMSLTWPKACRFGVSFFQSMPGHGEDSRSGAALSGGPRDRWARAMISMMLMRPPQQGQGER